MHFTTSWSCWAATTPPRVRGRGSAIFMHVARPGYAPTEGCIALARPHLLRLLERLGPRSAVAVPAP